MTCEKCDELMKELHKMRRLSKKLDSVLDSLYDGIFITDGQGIIIRVNHAYERITGIRGDHLIGKPVKYLVDEGIISRSCSELVLQNHKVTTIQQKLSSGKILLVSGTPVFHDDGDIEMVITNVRDMTELFTLKEEIHAKEKEKDFYSLELAKLRKQLYSKSELVTRQPEMQKIYDRARQLAKHNAPILICGENGVGKRTYVDLIHRFRDDQDMTLITWQVESIPLWENLYEKMVNLDDEKQSKILYLNGIEKLAIHHQEQLLEWLNNQSGHTNVRIIASSKHQIEALSNRKDFREELVYQLGVVPINMLPLRERCVDLMPLTNHFLSQFNGRYNENKRFEKDVLEAFAKYHWPGNIRELRSVIERMYSLSKSNLISADLLPLDIEEMVNEQEKISLKDEVLKLEMKYIESAMNRFGNVRDAAKYLGIDPSTLVRKRQKFNN